MPKNVIRALLHAPWPEFLTLESELPEAVPKKSLAWLIREELDSACLRRFVPQLSLFNPLWRCEKVQVTRLLACL